MLRPLGWFCSFFFSKLPLVGIVKRLSFRVNNRYSEVIVSLSLSLDFPCMRVCMSAVSVFVKLKRMTFRTNKMYETNASLPTWTLMQ